MLSLSTLIFLLKPHFASPPLPGAFPVRFSLSSLPLIFLSSQFSDNHTLPTHVLTPLVSDWEERIDGTLKKIPT